MELTNERQIEILRQMWLIRYFDEAAISLYRKGLYRGSTHPYIAQEATAVGVTAVLSLDDVVLATYRGHGAAIAKGADPKAMMAEMLGKSTGLNKGKGGSMHLADRSLGFIGSNAIVSGHIPMAGGVALANQLDKNGVVTVCFFGDGASCEGPFYETLNMATLWNLPLVLVVENNGIAISTHVSESISVPDISMRAQGFGLPGMTVDGRDVYAVIDAAYEAVERARRGDGPTLLEAKTVRWSSHSAVAAGDSKDADRWMETDPIPRYQAEMEKRGILTAAEMAQIEADSQAAIDEATQFAIDSADPSIHEIYTDIWVDVDAA
ncbi:MAG: thiamine pyrophosphate-dependent dehydrogenase E1 component subunit alpha [Anaerolineales bacterium]|jgi:pyruvate dehydrogenase E1 component alpha subunit|nr:thiamine pyrophosphate-dependent dehydrogenase E1 component subunit alpha [Alphaproteobacteria bacterium]MDP7643626.1 thiamine pyrophosphate-dependent dehydrogenase E1 component subunit alpha [Anaerolineales bacterium]|tara:strand:+ start:8924 stop:9889 length:966 start_codon:yes stop_codon:yes gene_type:complete